MDGLNAGPQENQVLSNLLFFLFIKNSGTIATTDFLFDLSITEKLKLKCLFQMFLK